MRPASKLLFAFTGATVLLAFLQAPLAIAQDAVPPKRSALSLYERFAGNTVTGYNTSGTKFTEFHSPDGRIFGYNSGDPALDACWRTVGQDVVCYYYGKGNVTGEFCWRFEPIDNLGYKIYATDSSLTGMVRVEAGNPHDLNDQGESWTCDALMSSAQPPRQSVIAHVQDPLP